MGICTYDGLLWQIVTFLESCPICTHIPSSYIDIPFFKNSFYFSKDDLCTSSPYLFNSRIIQYSLTFGIEMIRNTLHKVDLLIEHVGIRSRTGKGLILPQFF